MALSTAQSRAAWQPRCRSVHPFRSAYDALDAWFRTFLYRPGYGTGAANCRRITGGSDDSLHAFFGDDDFVFWNGYRLPLMALAVDVNPPRNPYARRLITDMPPAMVAGILGVRTGSGHQVWGWGGYFKRYKDAMHYEGVCTPAQLRTGIRASTLPGGAAAPAPAPGAPRPPTSLPTPTKEPEMFLAREYKTQEVYLFEDGRYTLIHSRTDVGRIAANAGISKTEAEIGGNTFAALAQGRKKYT